MGQVQPVGGGEGKEKKAVRPGGRGAVHGAAAARGPQGRRVVWGDVAGRFVEPRECLASYLALEAAEVLAGVKPANLISITDRTYRCGRNPYRLWKRWGRSVLESSPLHVHELEDRGDSVLVLLYLPEALDRLLAASATRAVLRCAGYPEEVRRAEALDMLARRLATGAFPHEIGVFLGYPLKDVAGFMGLARIPFTCQGPWKIYGDPGKSLRLAETYRGCRSRMAAELTCCATPYECLSGGNSRTRLSLREYNDTGCHNHVAACR